MIIIKETKAVCKQFNPIQADGPELTIQAGGGKNTFGPFNPPRESILMGVTIHTSKPPYGLPESLVQSPQRLTYVRSTAVRSWAPKTERRRLCPPPV